jgi:predicted secreted protein
MEILPMYRKHNSQAPVQTKPAYHFYQAAVLFAGLFLAAVPQSHADNDTVNYNQVNLEARVQRDIENDTMVVTLYAQEEGEVAAEAGNRVNENINAALRLLKAYPAIKVETESYTTTPVYNKSQVVGWRVKQSIVLESGQMALVSDVIGKLQHSLKLAAIDFDVSYDRREQVTGDLINEALAAFARRSSQVAEQLKRHGYKIVKLDIQTSGAEIQPRRNYRVMQAEAMSASVAPQMAAGDQQLSVTVRGTIELE